MSVLTEASSDRLRFIRFPLIISVVFRHSFEFVNSFSNTNTSILPTSFLGELVNDFVAIGILGIAVPAFFLMSGFLFFNNFEWSWPNYLSKLKSRLWTLLIPFLLWNLLWICIIAVAQNLSITSSYFSGGIPHITQSSPYEVFNLLIGIDRHPIAFQFWFIRDLISLVILVPLFRITHINTKLSYVVLIIFFAVWCYDIPENAVLSIVPSPLAVFFFYAGSLIAVKKKTPFFLDRFGLIALGMLFILICINIICQDYSFNQYIHKLRMMVGIVGGLYLTKYISSVRVKAVFVWLANVSFFVYAFHEPTLEILQRFILSIWIPPNDITRLLFSFILPFGVIAVSIGVYILIKRISPRFTALITGGRIEKPQKA